MTPTETPAITCPECKGAKTITGVFPVYADTVPAKERKPIISVACPLCQGTGTVDGQFEERARRGSYYRASRISEGIAARAFAKMFDLNPSKLLQFERGMKLDAADEQPIAQAYNKFLSEADK